MATIFFLAPSRPAARLMATYFESYCRCKLSDVMGAYTEHEHDFMISGDVDETYVDDVMNAMQSFSRTFGHLFSFQTVDKQFKMYRVTMIK